MAFNNRPATDTIPLLSPLLAPSARALGPLLAQLAAPGPLRATAESALDALKGLSPGLVRQVLPLVEQLTPIFMDVSQARETQRRALGRLLFVFFGACVWRAGACGPGPGWCGMPCHIRARRRKRLAHARRPPPPQHRAARSSRRRPARPKP